MQVLSSFLQNAFILAASCHTLIGYLCEAETAPWISWFQRHKCSFGRCQSQLLLLLLLQLKLIGVLLSIHDCSAFLNLSTESSWTDFVCDGDIVQSTEWNINFHICFIWACMPVLNCIRRRSWRVRQLPGKSLLLGCWNSCRVGNCLTWIGLCLGINDGNQKIKMIGEHPILQSFPHYFSRIPFLHLGGAHSRVIKSNMLNSGVFLNWKPQKATQGTILTIF